MGFRNAHLVVLFLIAASMVAAATANNTATSPDCGSQNPNVPKRIVVGGSENWHFGFNYTDWAIKNGPFYVNDVLVFKYDAPKGPNDHPHSVYSFPNIKSWSNCNLKRATLVANPKQGGGKGFEVVLKQRKPYYFGCGESKGIHCNLGMMKFRILPINGSVAGNSRLLPFSTMALEEAEPLVKFS